ncbi:AAA family ATPase [Chelatococcus sambhunathii]|uniref:AAA family ATPase n=1 Tax=Chelatococcus sambhunathii TaxID=363953 RepID=A0ABU1DC07_9HYPH|nr:AAA family ATPase [Chelatococcus sambhunathii]MDR4305655.1 AAA family ATPase [Chelatococcus sambhunathii]
MVAENIRLADRESQSANGVKEWLIGSATVGRHSTFQFFFDGGYDGLVPVIPASAGIRAAGKCPGLKGRDGWYPVKVTTLATTPQTIAAWTEMGAGVGIRCDKDVIAIDIDTLSGGHAERAHQLAVQLLGPSWPRIGRAPKVLLPYRVKEELAYRQYRFEDGVKHDAPGLIELLAGPTRWFVADNVHPKTGKPYHWPQGVPPKAELTEITRAQLDAYFAAITAEFKAAKGSSGSTVDRSKVNQETLKGDPALIREAMEALPNDASEFRYPEWSRVAAALRGACQDFPDLGRDLFEEWSDKVDPSAFGRDSEPQDPGRIYDSFTPPFGLGAGYLYALAETHSGGKFSRAEAWFDHEAAAAAELSQVPSGEDAANRFRFETMDDLAVAALHDGPIPLIKGFLDQGAMSVLYGESNVGKTFVALDIACHIALGKGWGGLKVTQGAVVYVAAEGGRGVAKRVAALCAKLGHSPNFIVLRLSVDLLHEGADLQPLIAAIKALGRPVSLVVIDTLSRAMAGGDENASTDMGAMVKNLDAIRQATSAHLMVVHHSGKDRAKGARGHSLLRAATDTEIEVSEGKFRATKQRDLDRNVSFAFGLEPITLGVDSDGDPISSCTVRLLPPNDEAAAGSAVDSERQRRVALAALRSLDGKSRAKQNDLMGRLVEELAKVGALGGASSPTVRKTLFEALGASGAEVEDDGLTFRLFFEKDGQHEKAPYVLTALRVPTDGGQESSDIQGDAGKLESSENAELFS